MKTGKKNGGRLAAALLALCAAGFMAGCRAIGEAKDDPFDDERPQVPASDFPLSTGTMVLLKDRGEKSLESLLDEESSLLTTIHWSVDEEGAGVVTLIASPDEPDVPGETGVVSGKVITVKPERRGMALITAKLSAKEGYALARDAEQEAYCLVTVLEDFTLDTSELIFFEGENPQSVGLDRNVIREDEEEELLKVAKITWSVDSSAVSVPAGSEGSSVEVSPGTAGAGTVVRATLSATNEAGFNGASAAASLNAKTYAAPAVTIALQNQSSIALGYDNAAQDYPIEAHYPNDFGSLTQAVTWTTSAAATADITSPGTPAGGVAQATLAAKSVGSAQIQATLNVAGRSFAAAPINVTVGAFDASGLPPEKVTLTGIAVGGNLPLVNTHTSTATITAEAKRNDSYEPGNKNLNWSAAPTGIVSFVDTGTANSKQIKAIGVGTATVTVQSSAATSVKATFTVTVTQFTMTVTGPGEITRGAAAITLNGSTTASPTTINGWTTASPLITLTDLTGASVKVAVSGLPTAETDVVVTAKAAANTSVTKNHTITVKPHRFNITYNPNGPTAAAYNQNNVVYGSSTVLTENQFRYDGYRFLKWSPNTDGTNPINAGSAVNTLNGLAEAKTVNGIVHLYAIWEEIRSVDAVDVQPAATTAYLPYLKVNDTGTLNAVVSVTSVTGSVSQNVNWTTSNSSVVDILMSTASSCQIKAKAKGTATIKATSTVDESKIFEYAVTAFAEGDWMADGGACTMVRIDSAPDAGYYEIHTFKATGSDGNTTFNGTFAWNAEVTPTAQGRLLVVGGGGGGGGANIFGGGTKYGIGGNGGNVVYNAAFALPSGSVSVTVGGGGGGGNSSGTGGSSGAESKFGTVTATGGAGGLGSRPSSAEGSKGTGSDAYDIGGTSVTYGLAGASRTNDGAGSAVANNIGKGGQGGKVSMAVGSESSYGEPGGKGGSGIVIVRFKYQ